MILVLVNIPSNLHGASLLKAHSWVKSHVARSNPGGSPDYKLSDASGNPMTLSDVVRNPNSDVIIEVATIDGARRNPASSLAPIPDIEFDYPTKPRSGDHLKALLPSDLSPALVTRVVAEQGLIRGLHTLNRLSVEDADVKPVTPTTAALMQLNEIRMNPGRTPFTKRTPEIYGSEKALASWLGDEFAAEYTKAEQFSTVNNAKIAAKYGLNKHDIQKFAKEVLSDYLLAASSNRGLIRALIRNNPSLKGNREVIAKLTQVFPCHPQPFYDGVQRVFVAHPAFIYPAYADTIVTQKGFSKTVINFISDYPQSITITGKLTRTHRKMDNYIGAVRQGGFKGMYNQFRKFVMRVDADDSADVIDAEYGTQGYWRTITDRLSQSPEVAVKKADFKPLQYFTDLGGFYPSPPPKWPKHIVYSIMDAFLENMPHLLASDGTAYMDPITMAQTLDKTLKIDKLEIGNHFTLENVKMEDLKPILEGGFSDAKLKNLIGEENMAKADDLGRQPMAMAIKGAFADAVTNEAVKGGTRKTVTYDSSGPKSVLEMAYDVAEISRAKYNQSLIGDDFKFVMAMLHVSIHTLNESSDPGDFTAENFTRYLSGVLGAKRGDELNRLRDRLAESEIEGDDEAMQFRVIVMANLMLIRNDIEARLPTMDEAARRREVNILQRQRAEISRDAEMDIRLKAGIMEYMQGTIDMVGA